MLSNRFFGKPGLLVAVTFCMLVLVHTVSSCNTQEPSIICQTGEATEVAENSVTLSGHANLSPDLTGSIKLGFLVSTQENPTIDNSIVRETNQMLQNGLFQISFIGLRPGTKYYYRAFLKRNDLYVYGLVNTFETKAIISFSVYASAKLFYDKDDIININSILFTGFQRDSLNDNDLEDIFLNLIQSCRHDFSTASLFLSFYDDNTGKHLRDEEYSVVYSVRTGRYVFNKL